MNYGTGFWKGIRGAYHCAELPLFFGTIRDLPLPQKDEIRAAYGSDRFDYLRKDFMRGRDQSFIA